MSNKSRTLYIGQTTDLARRVREHREKTFENGFTARYNFNRLVYFEVTDDVASAVARERQLKGWKRSRKVELIQRKRRSISGGTAQIAVSLLRQRGITGDPSSSLRELSG